MRRGLTILGVLLAATVARAAWERATDYPFPVFGATAGNLDGVLYAAGGLTWVPDEPAAVHDAFRYDRIAGAWEQLPDLPGAAWAACGAVADGRLFVIGGQNDGYVAQALVLAFDPGGNAWSRVADLPAPLYGAACAFDAAAEAIHVAGGLVENKAVDTITDVHYVYDVAADAWSASTPLPEALGGPAGGFVGGAFVVAAGNAYNDWPAEGATYVFDVGAETWSEGVPVPHERMYPGSAVVGDALYVLGGWEDGLDDPVTAVDVYRPGAGWTSFAALPKAGGMPAAVGAASAIVVIGGAMDFEGGAFLQAAYRYDFETNDPPRFVSDPPTTAVAGEFYQYDPVVVDPDPFDALTFALLEGPEAMTVDAATGRVYWTVPATAAGAVPVSLRVADPADASDVQSFEITVTTGDDDAGDDDATGDDDDDNGPGDAADGGQDDGGAGCCGG